MSPIASSLSFEHFRDAGELHLYILKSNPMPWSQGASSACWNQWNQNKWSFVLCDRKLSFIFNDNLYFFQWIILISRLEWWLWLICFRSRDMMITWWCSRWVSHFSSFFPQFFLIFPSFFLLFPSAWCVFIAWGAVTDKHIFLGKDRGKIPQIYVFSSR